MNTLPAVGFESRNGCYDCNSIGQVYNSETNSCISLPCEPYLKYSNTVPSACLNCKALYSQFYYNNACITIGTGQSGCPLYTLPDITYFTNRDGCYDCDSLSMWYDTESDTCQATSCDSYLVIKSTQPRACINCKISSLNYYYNGALLY